MDTGRRAGEGEGEGEAGAGADLIAVAASKEGGSKSILSGPPCRPDQGPALVRVPTGAPDDSLTPIQPSVHTTCCVGRALT